MLADGLAIRATHPRPGRGHADQDLALGWAQGGS